MQETVNDFFEKNYTPDMLIVLNKILNLLERLNVTTHELYLANKLFNIENEDVNFLSLEIINFFDSLLNSIQKEFGFTISEGFTLEQKVDFIQAYVNIEDYDNSEEIIRILETDDSDYEKIAQCLCLTYPSLGVDNTAIGEDNILAMLSDVDEAALITIERIHKSKINQGQEDSDLEAEEISESHINHIKAFEIFTVNKFKAVTKSINLVRQGYRVGLPFKIYWNNFNELVAQDLADNKEWLNEVSLELLGCLILSKEHWNNPALAFFNISEDLFTDIKVISYVNNFIKGFINEFMLFKAENRIK